MKAITTKYHSWTTMLPARIIARTASGQRLSLSTGNIDADTMEQQHAYVASRLAEHMGWLTPANYLIGGQIGAGEFAFVFSDSPIIAPKIQTGGETL